MSGSMRVYVVARYPTVRAGLTTLVQSQSEWTVVGEVGPATPLPSQSGEPPEGVDIVLADLDGLAEPEMVA